MLRRVTISAGRRKIKQLEELQKPLRPMKKLFQKKLIALDHIKSTSNNMKRSQSIITTVKASEVPWSKNPSKTWLSKEDEWYENQNKFK